MLSILIPVRNESDALEDIIEHFSKNLLNFNHEVLIINDFSEDDTLKKIENLILGKSNFRVLNNTKKGLGGAINLGIRESKGKNIAIMMADGSDDINDLINYNKFINSDNYDAILGSRFLKESKVIDYPFQKLILNRLFNYFVGLVFWNKYNDYTNALKFIRKVH